MSDMSEPKSGLSKLAGVAVRLAALWLLTGALFKLFAGSPKMLPPLVLDNTPFTAIATFHVVIAVELSLVMLAMLKPHLGWMPISALFGFFLVILVHQASLGAESCGCMGDTIKMSPYLMMAIDGVLLAFVLLTRPWRSLLGPGLSTAILLAGVVVSIAAPWIVLGNRYQAPPPVTVNGQPTGTNGAGGSGKTFVEMDPAKWIGQTIYDVADFTRWVPMEKIPSDGRIVMWRQGCDHCAKHLRDMANEKEATAPVLLVQVRDDLKASRAVDAMPSGANVATHEMPDDVEVLIGTPVEIRVEGGLVKAVLFQEDFERAEGK